MRAALLVIAVAASAGGCGGGPREEARDAVNDLYAAFRERDIRVEGMTPGHVVEYDGDWKVVALIR